MKVTKNTAIWDKIRNNLLNTVNDSIKIGFFSSSSYGPENDNLPVAQVARDQEEGTVHIPTRPFMRAGFGGALRAGKLDRNFTAALKRISEGSTFSKEFTILGPVLVKEMKQQIVDWDSPPNSPKTVEIKGFNDPLRDSDTMLNSVEYRIGEL